MKETMKKFGAWLLAAALAFAGTAAMAADYAAKTEDGTTYASLADALAAVTKDNALTEVSEEAWPTDKQAYYNGSFYEAFNGALKGANSDAEPVVYVRPNYKGLTVSAHDHLSRSITIFGNNAEVNFSGSWQPSVEFTAPDGEELQQDVHQLICNLHNGAAFWGGRSTSYEVNVELYRCENVHEVLLNSPTTGTGLVNIKIEKCTFDGNGKASGTPVTTVFPGTVVVKDCEFKNVKTDYPININNKTHGTINVTVEGCTFDNCGGANKETVRLTGKVADTEVVGLVKNCTFTNPAGSLDIIVGNRTATDNKSAVSCTVVNTAANIGVIELGAGGDAIQTAAIAKSETPYISGNVAKNVVAKIGTVEYETLAAAFAAAKNGDTVELLAASYGENDLADIGKLNDKNVTVVGLGMDKTELKVVYAKNASDVNGLHFQDLTLTINHSGYGMPYTQTLCGTYERVKFNGLIAVDHGTSSFKDCVFTGTTTGDEYILWQYGGVMLVEGCTFKASASKGVVKLYCESSYEAQNLVKDCVFESVTGSKGCAIYASNSNNLEKPIYEMNIVGNTIPAGIAEYKASGDGLTVVNPVKDANGKFTSGTFISGNANKETVAGIVGAVLAENCAIVPSGDVWTVGVKITEETIVTTEPQESKVEVPQEVIKDAEVAEKIEQSTKVEGVKLSAADDEGKTSGIVAVVEEAKKNTEFAAAVDAAAEVSVKVEVEVKPTEYDNTVDKGKVAFKLTPKATVTVVQNETELKQVVPVTNDMIDQNQKIAVSIYTGFPPVAITHDDDNGSRIELFEGDQIVYNEATGVATVLISHFSTLTSYGDANDVPEPKVYVAYIGTTGYETIQAAVDAADVSQGPVTIMVMAGTHNETIYLNRANLKFTEGNVEYYGRVTIQAAEVGNVILNGCVTASPESGNYSDISVVGLTMMPPAPVSGSSCGLYLEKSGGIIRNIMVSNCVMTVSDFGVYVNAAASTNIVVKGCTINGASSWGVNLGGIAGRHSGIVVSGCTFQNGSDGAALFGSVEDSSVTGNTFTDVYFGLYVNNTSGIKGLQTPIECAGNSVNGNNAPCAVALRGGNLHRADVAIGEGNTYNDETISGWANPNDHAVVISDQPSTELGYFKSVYFNHKLYLGDETAFKTLDAAVAASKDDEPITIVNYDSSTMTTAPEGWEFKTEGGVTKLVKKAAAVAKVIAAGGTETGYLTLQAAFAAVKSDETVELVDNVDLKGDPWTPVVLNGNFDGKDFAISNLVINLPEQDGVGFFSQVSSGKTISNVNFVNVDVTGLCNVGAVVGKSCQGASNVTVTGAIKVRSEGYDSSTYARTGVICGGDAYGEYVDILVDGGDMTESYVIDNKIGGAAADGRYVAGMIGHSSGVTRLEGCTVKNLKIDGKKFSAGLCGVGPMSALCKDCTVENVYLHGQESGAMFGWLSNTENCPAVENATIRNVTFNSTGGCGTIGGYEVVQTVARPTVVVKNATIVDVTPVKYNYQVYVTESGDNYHYANVETAIAAVEDLSVLTATSNQIEIPEAYEFYEKGEGLWGVRQKATPVVRVGTKEYATIAAALADSEGEVEMTLLANAETGNIVVRYNDTPNAGWYTKISKLTLDLNGYALAIEDAGGWRPAIQAKASTIIVKDSKGTGTFTYTDGQFAALYSDDAYITVESGNFILNTGDYLISTTAARKSHLAFKGGTYNINPANDWGSSYVPEGYEAVKNANGTWTVKATYVAEIFVGGESKGKYETVGAALRAAANFPGTAENPTIVQLASGIVSDKNFSVSDFSLTYVTVQGSGDHATEIKNTSIQADGGKSVLWKGVTFKNIVFDNSHFRFTTFGLEDLTFDGNVFRNLDYGNTEAGVHFNLDAERYCKNLTYVNNLFDTSKTTQLAAVNSQSGLTGNIVITNNVFKNSNWRSLQLQIRTNDGVEDNLLITDNWFNGNASAMQITKSGDHSDAVSVTFNYNAVDDGANISQIIIYNFDLERLALDVAHNYYLVSPDENPGKFYLGGTTTCTKDNVGPLYPYYANYDKEALEAGTKTVREALYNLVELVEPVAEIEIPVDDSGEAVIPVKVVEEVFEQKSGQEIKDKDGNPLPAPTTTEEKQQFLVAEQPNGLKVWQNVAMGVDGNTAENALATISREPTAAEKAEAEKDGKTVDIVINTPISEFDPPTTTGVTVSYKLLRSVNGGVTWTEVATNLEKPEFPTYTKDDALISEGDTFWKFQAVFTSQANEQAE